MKQHGKEEYAALSNANSANKDSIALALHAIADGLLSVASAIHSLGNGNAATDMGAIEAFSVVVKEGFSEVANALEKVG